MEMEIMYFIRSRSLLFSFSTIKSISVYFCVENQIGSVCFADGLLTIFTNLFWIHVIYFAIFFHSSAFISYLF